MQIAISGAIGVQGAQWAFLQIDCVIAEWKMAGADVEGKANYCQMQLRARVGNLNLMDPRRHCIRNALKIRSVDSLDSILV